MYDVITIGTATRDVFLKSELFKAVKDSHFDKKSGFPTGEAECFPLGAKLEVEKPVFTVGGGATNAAVAFARFHFNTATVIRIGNDVEGEGIVDELKKEEIKTFDIRDSKEGTGYSTILLDTHGERTVLVYRGASGNFKEDEISFDAFKCDVLYIVPATIPFNLVEKVIDESIKRGCRFIAINPSKYYVEAGAEKLKNILSKSLVVILNREEASTLTGVNFDDEKGIFRAFDALHKGIVVMTDGFRGVFVSDGERIYKAGVFKEKHRIDRTGAGDAFGSGFVAAMMSNGFEINEKNVSYAIRYASANATSVVEYIGSQSGILTREQFEGDDRWSALTINVSSL